jgi:hypothetical protein
LATLDLLFLYINIYLVKIQISEIRYLIVFSKYSNSVEVGIIVLVLRIIRVTRLAGAESRRHFTSNRILIKWEWI